MGAYTRTSNPFGGGSWKHTNVALNAAIRTYCAIVQIPYAAFYVIQGSYNTGVAASAGTHDGPDTVDTLITVDDWVARLIGINAQPREWPGNRHSHWVRNFSYRAAWLALRQWQEWIRIGSDGTGDLSHVDGSRKPRFRSIRHVSGPTSDVYVVKRITASYNQPGKVGRRSTLKPGKVIDNVCGIVKCRGRKYLVTSVNRQPVFVPLADTAKLDRYRGKQIDRVYEVISKSAPSRPGPFAALPPIPGWSLPHRKRFRASREFLGFVRERDSKFRWVSKVHLNHIKK